MKHYNANMDIQTKRDCLRHTFRYAPLIVATVLVYVAQHFATAQQLGNPQFLGAALTSALSMASFMFATLAILISSKSETIVLIKKTGQYKRIIDDIMRVVLASLIAAAVSVLLFFMKAHPLTLLLVFIITTVIVRLVLVCIELRNIITT